MSRSAILPWLLVVLSAGFGVFQTINLRRWQEIAHSGPDASNTTLAQLQQRISELERRTAPTSVTASPPPEADRVAALAEERKRQQDVARQRAQQARARLEAEQSLALHPDVQELNFKTFSAGLPRYFAAYYREAALTPEQIAKFEALQSARFWAMADFLAAAAAQKLSPTSAAYAETKTHALLPFVNQAQELLGQEGYQAFTEYENAGATRDLAHAVAAQLAATGAALRTDQIDRLAHVFAARRLTPPASDDGWSRLESTVLGRNGNAPTVTLTDIQWDRAAVDLRSLLSLEQLAVVDSLRTEIRLRKELGWRREELLLQWQHEHEKQRPPESLPPPAASGSSR